MGIDMSLEMEMKNKSNLNEELEEKRHISHHHIDRNEKINYLPPSPNLLINRIQPEANDRSEFPKGFGVQQMHLEEIVDHKNEIQRLKNEKYALINKMNNIQENAKLTCFKYEESLKEMKQKLKKFKNNEVGSYRGTSWLKKTVSSCKVENELRKKNLKISKLTNQIQKLQGQIKYFAQDNHLGNKKRFSTSGRISSNTESKNSLYQRE